jgi:hypothetical protein
MTDLEFLKAVRARIAEPESWSKHSYFRDHMGRSIWEEASYPTAVSWTLGGAAQAVSGYASGATLRLATLLGFQGAFPVNAMNDWQDAQMHGRVLKRLDKAIGDAQAVNIVKAVQKAGITTEEATAAFAAAQKAMRGKS